jgi:hypothetical protein
MRASRGTAIFFPPGGSVGTGGLARSKWSSVAA